MTGFVDRLFALWTTPADGPGAREEFAAFYTDPVLVNGTPTSLDAMVERAVSLQRALSDLQAEILQVAETTNTVTVAFVMRGRHTGVYPTPVGAVPPTGREVAIRTIDLLTITDSRISAIWVQADELGLLRQLGAVVEGSD